MTSGNEKNKMMETQDKTHFRWSTIPLLCCLVLAIIAEIISYPLTIFKRITRGNAVI